MTLEGHRKRLVQWPLGLNRILPLLWTTLLSILLTWPMVLRPGTEALGSQNGDGMKHLWTLWWMRSSVWDGGTFPFHTLRVNYPTGMDLYPIEPLNGVFAVLFPFLDIVTTSNLLVFGNLTLTGLAAYWMGKVLTGSRMAGLVSATLLQGSAIMAFFVHVGVGELNHLWWLPLGMGCLIQARRTGQWLWFLALSMTLVGAMLSCFYLGFFLALSVLVWAVCSLMPLALQALRRGAREAVEGVGLLFHSSSARMSRLAERGRVNSLWSGAPLVYALVVLPFRAALSLLQWAFMAIIERRGFSRLTLQYAVAAVLAVAIVWPVTQEFAASYKTGDVPEVGLKNYLTENHQQPVTDPPHERLELSDLVESREASGEEEAQDPGQMGQQRGIDSRKTGAYGGGRFLGWTVVLVVGLGLIRRPKESIPWVLVGGVGILFALGTYYTVDDLPVSVKWDADMVLSCLNDEAFVGTDGQEQACTPPKEDSVEGKIRLPLLWLNRLLGYLAEPLNFPVRFLAMTALAISALGALAVAPLQWPERVRSRVPTLPAVSLRGRSFASWPMLMVGYSLICLVTVSRGQLLDWPWARFTLRPAKELEVLRDEPDLAVVDLGLTLRSDEENRFSALATQIAHGKAMNAVPVERIEFFAREGKHFVSALQLVSDLAPLYQGGEGSVPGQCSDGIDNDGNSFADCMDEAGCKRYTACGGQIEDSKDAFPQYKPDGFYRGDMALLRDAGFGWMVVSYRKGDQSMPPTLQSTLDQVLGPSVVLGPGLGAWEIPEVEYSEGELEIWAENHAKRVADAQATAPTMGPADGANPAGGATGPSGPTPPPAPPPMR